MLFRGAPKKAKLTKLRLSILIFAFAVIGIAITSVALESKARLSAFADTYQTIAAPSVNNGASFDNYTLTPDNSSIADPTILKDGNSYYIAKTTSWRGVYIHKSDDFKDWKTGFYGLSCNANFTGSGDDTRITQFSCPGHDFTSELSSGQTGVGFWAPEIYKHNNKFYLLVTYMPTFGNAPRDRYAQLYLAEADTLSAGSFTNFRHIDVAAQHVIDGNLFFDDDGRIYLYFKDESEANNWTIKVVELDANFNRKTAPKIVLNSKELGWESSFNEGSWMMKKNGTYYLMYSANYYKCTDYEIGYATATSPTALFEKQNTAFPLLSGYDANLKCARNNGEMGSWDSDNHVYGTGHHSVLKVSEDEYYILYHSINYNDGSPATLDEKYKNRRLNADRLGFDSNGRIFVNGPTTRKQPLPSGTNGFYQLSNNYYSLNASGSTNADVLRDKINYNSKNTAEVFNAAPTSTVGSLTTDTLTYTLNKRMDIADIWLYANPAKSELSRMQTSTAQGAAPNFSGVTADVIINNQYIMQDVNLGNDAVAKIQLPNASQIPTHIGTIKVKLSKATPLTETILVSNTLKTYEDPVSFCAITFDANGGNTASTQLVSCGGSLSNLPSSSRDGYTFDGWYTAKTGGNKLTTATVINNDIVYYAHWTQNPTINAQCSDIDYGEIVFIGDSYGNAYNAENLRTNVIEKSWPNQTAALLGAQNFVNMSYGGAGFARSANSVADTYFDTMIGLTADKVSDKAKVRWIVTQGGYNDQSKSSTDILAHAANFSSAATSLYPNARLAIGMIGWDLRENIQNQITNNSLPIYRTIAEDYGMQYIDGSDTTLHNRPEYFSNDNFHPNVTGELAIAEHTANFLCENTLNINYHVGNELSKTIYTTGKTNKVKSISSTASRSFKGWATSPDGAVKYAGNTLINDDFIKANKVVDLYAVFADIHSVAFTDGQGNTLKTEAVEHGSSATPPANPSRPGYTFAGWNKSHDNIASDTVIEAAWTPHVLYVRYNANGGIMAEEHDSNISLDQDGWVVNTNVGWASDEAGNYRGRFGAYGGSILNTGLTDYNNSNYLNLIRAGHHIEKGKEWNTKPDGTGISYNQATVYQVSDLADLAHSDQTLILYANWQQDPVEKPVENPTAQPSSQNNSQKAKAAISNPKTASSDSLLKLIVAALVGSSTLAALYFIFLRRR